MKHLHHETHSAAGGAATPANPSPLDTVVSIDAKMPDGTDHFSSGVLVAPDEVLTAAHAVWEQGVGAATSVTVTPELNGSAKPLGTIAAADFHYFPVADANDMINQLGSEQDFALIHLSRPVGLGEMTLDTHFVAGAAHITGYPQSAGLTHLVDVVTNTTVDPRFTDLDFHNAAIGPGDSGGPIWEIGSDGHAFVAGVVSTASWGGEITPQIAGDIENWAAADHGALVAGASDPGALQTLSAHHDWFV